MPALRAFYHYHIVVSVDTLYDTVAAVDSYQRPQCTLVDILVPYATQIDTLRKAPTACSYSGDHAHTTYQQK